MKQISSLLTDLYQLDLVDVLVELRSLAVIKG